jgi:hypothetical protein
MAAVLWGGGITFGGVLAFLYADLIVLPLLDVYRRYFGWKMAAYIGIVFYITMVISAILMDSAFSISGLAPPPRPNIQAEVTHLAINYTFFLNLAFGAIAAYLFGLSVRNPMRNHGGHSRHNQGQVARMTSWPGPKDRKKA